MPVKTETKTEAGLLGFGSGFTMAFQPIVDLARREIYAHEALVRGISGESASEVLSRA